MTPRLFSTAARSVNNSNAFLKKRVTDFQITDLPRACKQLGLNIGTSSALTLGGLDTRAMCQRVVPESAWGRLEMKPVELLDLAQAIPDSSSVTQKVFSPKFELLTITRQTALKEKLAQYQTLLYQLLFNNQLSTRLYDGSENVDELFHAKLAFTLAKLFGQSSSVCLIMANHDIGRMAHSCTKHGDEHHMRDGSIINAPLGVEEDFADVHALFKHIWRLVSPTYNADLISPVSIDSHKTQANQPLIQFAKQIEQINYMGDKAVDFICHMLLLRLIDDMAKVPRSMLIKNKEADFLPPTYYMDLVRNQLIAHVNQLVDVDDLRLANQNTDNLYNKLDTAIAAMLHAAPYFEEEVVTDPGITIGFGR